MSGFDVYWLVLGSALLLAPFAAWHAYRRTRGRWGHDVETVSHGEGAYRSGTTERRTPIRAPGSVFGAGVGARIWGVLTLLVFAPAGALAACMMIGASEPAGTIGGLVVGALSLSGLGLGFAYFGASRAIEKRNDLDVAHGIERWSFAHHALVVLTFVVAGFAINDEAGVLAIATVLPVCLVGMAITGALRNARHTAAEIV